MTKDEIRTLSRARGLPTWNKPALACLASRVPYGQTITRAILERIDAAERFLRQSGVRECRVRHHGSVARIEVAPGDISRLAAPGQREAITAKLRALGYQYVCLDLSGYRRGALNETLDLDLD